MPRTGALGATLLTLGVLACGAGEAVDMENIVPTVLTEAEALAIVDRLNEALISRDATRIKGHYAADAVVLGLEATAPFPTRADIEADLDRFAAAGFDTYALGTRRVQVIGANHFVLTGVSTLGNSSTGASFPVRYSEVFARQDDGTWQIIAEHISAMPGG